ncbi:MAG TPA: nuclear transport factor 2 family protein [Solirubrobacteraceae bacterium]|nr:nuclear transport factor 2 family protein [Solirubrobacteraceae bacterium]
MSNSTATATKEMHPRAKQVEDAIRLATYDGDFSAMEALISPDAVLYAHCKGPMGGVHRGRDACLGNFKHLDAFVNGSLHLDTLQTMGTDAFVVMHVRATAVRSREMIDGSIDRAELDEPISVTWRFVDGQCVEFFDHFHNPAAWDAFWRFDDYNAVKTPPSSGGVAAEKVTDTVERISREGNNDLLREFFSPDVVSDVDGNSPLGGIHEGIDSVLAGFGRVYELTGGQFTVEAEDVLANEHWATIFNRITATYNGNSIEHMFCTIWRIEDGKVTNVFLHFEDVEKWDAFWAEAS